MRGVPYQRSNYRVGWEPPWKERAALFTTASVPGIPRSLRTPISTAPARYAPGAPPIPQRAKVAQPPKEVLELPADSQKILEAMDALLRSRPLVVQENPVPYWRVDLIPLVLTASTWLDQLTPIVAGTSRYIDRRRAVTIINHDAAFNVWIRHTQQGVIQGGFIPPLSSISMPLASVNRIFAQAQNPAGSNISFYQLGD